MAANQSFPSERFISGAPSNPAVPTTGQACRYGNRIGVALANQDTSGNQAMDFGGVYNLPVKGADDGGNIAVAVGDPLFWTDADGVTNLSKKASGYFAGYANATVASGATSSIDVVLTGVADGYSGGPVGQVRLYQATYDFAKLGGAIGAITFGAGLPANALIIDGMIDIITALTSGGSATIAVGSGEAANDLHAALAVASWTINTRLDIVPVGTAATAVKTTAARQPSLTIATAALTAGKFNLILRYAQSA